MMWSMLFLGLGIGSLLAIPAATVWARRTEARVRQAEQRAQAAERLAELGTLTGGLAHEIKNPLSTIGLNLQLLDEDLDELSQQFRRLAPEGTAPEDKIGRLHRRFGSLLHEAQRLREILDDFLRFAGRVRLEREPADVNALVRELTDFYEPQAAEARVRLRPELAADPGDAPIDAHLLKQALLNLIINATQAMSDARAKGQPHGGADELIVRTDRRRQLGEDRLRIHIIDTGPGMPDDVAAKIFQPYFSTKRGGTGLGLPTSRRIIEEHGGTLEVQSEPGRGTDFIITLPTELPDAEAGDGEG